MTTPSTARKAGPYNGTGSQVTFPFTFKVFAASDIKVIVANAAGTETVLTLGTNYSVTLNSNQESSPGGTIRYPISGAAMPVGSKLSIIGNLPYDQPLDLPSGGNYSPLALENQLDRSAMQIQQLAEQMARAVKVPVTDDGTGELSGDLAQGILSLAPLTDEIDAVAGNATNINTVAGISSNVTTVAGISSNVTTVAGISSNVTAVAGNATNINAVAAKTAEITTVAGNVADVVTVADIAADVTAVAGVASDLPTVAENVASIQNFSDVYQGPKASDPTLRNDGNPLQVGDLYFSTASNAMRVYSAAGWAPAGEAVPLSITPQSFSGNGSTTTFTLATAPAFEAACDVYISGIHQMVGVDYNITGTSLVFTTAPPSGTDNIDVKILSAYAGGVPNNGSVTTEKIAAGVSISGLVLADGYTEEVFALTGATPTLNPGNGSVQTWTLGANSTPVDGLTSGQSLTLMIDDGSAFTITWPSVVWKTDGGTAPALNTTGLTAIVLWKVGATLYGARVGNA